MSESQERPTICGYRIIGEVACDDLPQPVSLFWDSLVHSLLQLCPDFLRLRPHTASPRLPLKLECSPARFAAGESDLELDRRKIHDRLAELKIGWRISSETTTNADWWPYCAVSRDAKCRGNQSSGPTAYDGGGDGRRRSQQRASQYDRRNTEINHQARNVYQSSHKRG